MSYYAVIDTNILVSAMLTRHDDAAMKAENPKAIVVAGIVNRIWYEEACLRARAH